MTCLHYGAKAGHLEIIRYILDIEAIDVNATVSAAEMLIFVPVCVVVPVWCFVHCRAGLLIHMSNIWCYVMSHIRPAGRLRWQKLQCWALHANFLTSCSYLPCLLSPLTSAILCHFHWPWPCLGVTRSVQSKTLWLHFLVLFSTDQDEIGYGVEASNIQGRELCYVFMNCMFSIILC